MRRATFATAVVMTTAAVVGCGGGGGGGTSGSSLVTSGSSGGSGGTGSTTGAILTGSSSGATTGTSSTGTATTGTATTGTSTTGSSTTGTTGGFTGPTTSGGSSSGSTGGYPNGYVRANAIYFGHYTDMSVVSSVLPDGSGRQDSAGGDANVLGAVPDPSGANHGGLVYAKWVNGGYGIYRGTSFDVSASTELAPPIYDYVGTLQATPTSVVFVASDGGSSKLYQIANGAVAAIDDADEATATVDGTQIAYTKSVGAYDDLFVWNAASGISTPLNTGANVSLPSFSKDGAWLLFSSTRDEGDQGYDLYQIASAGGAPQRLTSTASLSELGGCYNESRTAISFVGQSSDPNQCGVYVLSNGVAKRITGDTDVNLATYWTDSAGRAIGRAYRGRFQRLLRKGRNAP